MTQQVEDPLKKAVASPLSKYLAENVGKGVDPYPGDVTTQMDPQAMGAYNEFLSMDAGEWFDRAVSDPTIRDYKENILPGIQEGYAGRLRGSGRWRSEEDAGTNLMLGLAQQRAKAEMTVPQQQFNMGISKYNLDVQNKSKEVNEWMRTQPEYSPILDKAMAFLSNSTSSGTDTLAAMMPEQQGFLPQLLGAGMGALGNMDIGGMLGGLGGGGGGGTNVYGASPDIMTSSGSGYRNYGSIPGGNM